MRPGNAEIELAFEEYGIVEFIDVEQFHVDQSQIRKIGLNQITGPDGAVFFQNDRNIRVLSLYFHAHRETVTLGVYFPRRCAKRTSEAVF